MYIYIYICTIHTTDKVPNLDFVIVGQIALFPLRLRTMPYIGRISGIISGRISGRVSSSIIIISIIISCSIGCSTLSGRISAIHNIIINRVEGKYVFHTKL